MKLLVLSKKGCTPCQMVKEFLDEQKVVYDNVDVQFNPELAAQFRIMSVPVTVLIDDEGKEVARSNSFNPAQLEQMIDQLGE